jgi:glycosyltransferase involved in cell wall biosynthesis
MNTPNVTYGILSSAPPTPCGIATFSTALGQALTRQGVNVRLVRVLDAPEVETTSPFRVTAELIGNDPASIEGAIQALNDCDAAVIQHEYGLFGGSDGSDVIRVLDGLFVPVVAILHTVLPRPTPHQLEVLNALIRRVDRIVVMTGAAEATLRQINDVGSTMVEVIPHGAAVSADQTPVCGSARPLLLTWGLIGPGKGIEWMIDALVRLRDLRPQPHYVIAGRTHPKVLAREGDVYRQSLESRARINGVEPMVTFDNSYRDLDSLGSLIADAAVVVLPYDSSDQATSGVLVDAIAAGRPVVATDFPHSRELLATGAGFVVAHRDPDGLARALRRILTDGSLADSMAAEARRLAPSLGWDEVARQYKNLVTRISPRVGV